MKILATTNKPFLMPAHLHIFSWETSEQQYPSAVVDKVSSPAKKKTVDSKDF
jgi:hypothetical protein